MIYAIIDIGSNTVRMAIYDIDKENGTIDMLFKQKHIVGLAAYVKGGVMQQDGIDKVCSVLDEYINFLNQFSIDNAMAFTTAALRNCSNSQSAIDEIISRTGIKIKVISGEQEAEYDFVGATRNVQSDDGFVVDIGGGSTELIYYRNRKIVSMVSLPIGSLSVKGEFIKRMIPLPEEVEIMYAEARQVIESATEFKGIIQPDVCGIGGTLKATLALYNNMFVEELGLSSDNAVINTDKLESIVKYFVNEGTRAAIPLEASVLLMKSIPDRIHTIISGLCIVLAIKDVFGIKRITYSDTGVREGFIVKEILK